MTLQNFGLLPNISGILYLSCVSLRVVTKCIHVHVGMCLTKLEANIELSIQGFYWKTFVFMI